MPRASAIAYPLRIGGPLFSLGRGIARDVGAALAVVAIYALTLLLPLHQAAGLQRDLGRLGFEAIAGWSICTPLAQDEQRDSRNPAAVKCPAAGVAKHELAAVLPTSINIGPAKDAFEVRYVPPLAGTAFLLPDHFAQPRAPPVTV